MLFFPVDLNSFYNNDGFAIMGNFSAMDDFDFNGYCYPADTPEANMKWGKVEIEGVRFFMPSSPNGPNNIACSSQKIPVEANKPTPYMILIESATNGNWRERIKVVYRDGSYDDVEVRFTDWAQQPSKGEIPVFVFPFRYNVKEGNVHEILVSIFMKAVPLSDSKIVKEIVLPDNPNVHVFAITLATSLPEGLKEKLAKEVALKAPWDKIPWYDYKQPPKEAWTCYQTSSTYTPTVDAKADAVIVYDAYPSKVATWRNRGTHLWAMYNSFWASSALGIFRKHPEIIQTKKDGKPWVLIQGRYWVVPLQPWKDFVFKKVKDGLDAGVESIFLEEPEFSWEAGYGEGFKKAWKEFYGEEWKPLNTDRDTAFKGGRLMAHLVDNFYRDVFARIKQEKPSVKTYVATHSIFHYITMFVTPFAGFFENPYSDGVIGQVWTGTARLPFTLKGEFGEHIFHRAYLEYSFFASFKRGWKNKDMIFLTDPVEDNPNYTWEGYRRWYLQTLSACLLFPEVDKYELLPWPERVIAKGVKYGGQEAPPDYITQLFLLWDLQRKLHFYSDDFEYISGKPSFMAFISQTASYQKVGGFSFDFDSYLSMVGPLIDVGEGVYSYPVESVLKGGFPKDFSVALLDYSVFKPEDPRFNELLKDWVSKGGKLVIFGGYDEFCDLGSSWWKKEGYDAPTDHLLAEFGLKYDKEVLKGKGEFKEILNSLKIFGKSFHDLSNLGEYTIDLSKFSGTGWVLVRISDATPTDGWGPTIKKVVLEKENAVLSFVPGTPQENDYIKSFSPPGGITPDGRYVDASGYVEYVFEVDENSVLKLTMGNDFKVEVKPFAAVEVSQSGLLKPLIKKYGRFRFYAPLTFYELKNPPRGYRVFARDTDGRPLVWKIDYGRGQIWHVAFTPSAFASDKGYRLALAIYKSVKGELNKKGYFALRRGPYIVGYTTKKPFRLKGRYIDLLDPEMPLVHDPVVDVDSPFLFAIPSKLPEGPFLASGRIKLESSTESGYNFVVAGPPYRVNVVAVKLPSVKVPVAVEVKDYKGSLDFEVKREDEFLKIFFPGQFNGAKVFVRLGEKGNMKALEKYRLSFKPRYLGYMKRLLVKTYPAMKEILSIKEGSWFNLGGKYLYLDGGVSTTGTYVYCDGSSYGVWRFPVSGLKHLMVALKLANNFRVSFSKDGVRWSLGADSQKLYGKDYHAQENEGVYFFDVSDFLPADYIYVKLEDASPSDGWGGILKSIRIMIPPIVESGEPLVIAWMDNQVPPMVGYDGTYYCFSPKTEAFSFYGKIKGAKYYLKLYPRSSGYVKIGTLNLPVLVLPEEEKLEQLASVIGGTEGVALQKPSPLVDVIASSIALALNSPQQRRYKVFDSVPQGYSLLAAFDTSSDERYVVEDGSQKDGIFKYTDGRSKVVYRIPVSPKAKSIVVGIKVGNDFLISVSKDGKSWTKVVNSVKLLGRSYRDLRNYRWYYFEVPLKLPAEEIFLKITDATPENGWGAKFSEIKVYGRLP